MGQHEGIKTQETKTRLEVGTRVRVNNYLGVQELLGINPDFLEGRIIPNSKRAIPYDVGYKVAMGNGVIYWLFGECLEEIVEEWHKCPACGINFREEK
jgi:hypothetical protein